MRRIGYVLQALFSQIGELGRNRSAHLPPGLGGDADPTGRRQAFEPCRDVDAVTVDVVGRNDHVTDIDADAELQPPIERPCDCRLTVCQ